MHKIEGSRREWFCCWGLFSTFSSDSYKSASQDGETDPCSHVADHMSVFFVPLSCNQFRELFMIPSGLRTHPTICSVNKGGEGSSFHCDNSGIVLAHFFKLLIPV